MHPFVKNAYDADPNGVTWSGTNDTVGQLTQSLTTTYLPAPDNTQGQVTENMQYDQRGQLITQRLNITASGGTLSFPSLPQYQQTLAYNDVNQLTTTQTTIGGAAGSTFTQSYDSTTGIINGLSNTSTGNQSLAALGYNLRALPGQVTYKASDGTTALATTNYTYDGDLRPAGSTST